MNTIKINVKIEQDETGHYSVFFDDELIGKRPPSYSSSLKEIILSCLPDNYELVDLELYEDNKLNLRVKKL
jgi:hypothetical protein